MNFSAKGTEPRAKGIRLMEVPSEHWEHPLGENNVVQGGRCKWRSVVGQEWRRQRERQLPGCSEERVSAGNAKAKARGTGVKGRGRSETWRSTDGWGASVQQTGVDTGGGGFTRGKMPRLPGHNRTGPVLLRRARPTLDVQAEDGVGAAAWVRRGEGVTYGRCSPKIPKCRHCCVPYPTSTPPHPSSL